MTDRQPGARPPAEPDAAKRPWSPPTLEVIDVEDSEGPSPAFPVVDSVTGMS